MQRVMVTLHRAFIAPEGLILNGNGRCVHFAYKIPLLFREHIAFVWYNEAQRAVLPGDDIMEIKKTIYIADDEQNIREAIKTFLESEGYAVAAFENGDLLLETFQKAACDLVILDVMMPGLDGFAVCAQLRKLSTVPIIMLTARDSDLDYATGLSLGSDDYFTKPFSAMALVMRVKAIFRRIEFEKQSVVRAEDARELSFGDITINLRAKSVKAAGGELALTPNEYDLLKYLMEKNDQAISRDELLENIWGYNTEIETRATDDTVRRLRKKLEHSSVAIEAVWGFGFRLKVRDENG